MTQTQRHDVLLAVPARGGSKRLPRKNVLDVHGVPMIVHTIEAAQKTGLAKEVFVCTDDEQIAAIAREVGALVYMIPEEMAADDISSTTPVLKLLEDLEPAYGLSQPDFIFNLQPTSPLRGAEDILGTLEALEQDGADFAVSVTEIDPHYFHWALQQEDSNWRMYFNDQYLKERIYLPTVMRPNGAVKLARTDALVKTGHYFGSPLTVYAMPEERSIHVATDFDLTCVRAIAEKMSSRV